MAENVSRLGGAVLREGIADQVVELILEQIRSGHLVPGQKLPAERELARQLGVGRPSLREALRALSLLGVLNIRHGEGVFVSQLGPADLLEPLNIFLSLNDHSLDQLFEARIIIESGITGIAAHSLDKERLAVLKRCVEEGEKMLGDAKAFLELDVRFHQTILESAGNPFLEKVMGAFHELMRASRTLTAAIPRIREQSHLDHMLIFDALLYRDEDKASRAMVTHLRNVSRGYRGIHDRSTGGSVPVPADEGEVPS